MKRRSMALLALVVTQAGAAGLTFKDGTVCDAAAGFCADAQGVSASLTQMYLGDKAGQKLTDRIAKAGKDFDATRFTMSGGLTCWTGDGLCFSSRLRDKIDVRATRTLFGKDSVGDYPGVTFKDNAVCDKRAGLCADAMGLSMGLTEMYLGKAAAQKLEKIVASAGKDFDATRFTLNGGLTCHTQEKKCWSSKLRQTVDVRATYTLFRP